MNIRNILFVDANISDFQKLTQRIEPETKVVVLDALQSGITQITEILAQYNNLESIQILSHGTEGQLQLGSTVLNKTQLEAFQHEIFGWGNALMEQGDILLYGCDVANGSGQAFVQQLSQVTGADVAASTDWTGSHVLGGDWTLEYETGSIESALNIAQETLDQYEGVFNIYNVTNTEDSGNGSLRSVIEDVKRSAIKDAKSNNVQDIIDLRGVSGSIDLDSSLPTIDHGGDVFFVGNGDITVNGRDKYQIIALNNTGITSFRGITFENGYAKGGDASAGGGGGLGAGGAVFVNQGRVVFDTVKFKGNKAEGGSTSGGANGGDNERDGGKGGAGGRLNASNASFDLYKGGSGGAAGIGNGGNRIKGGQGTDGGFGSGGGGGGGGGGGDDYGHGGKGGDGGFGAGGGAGGGGGHDYDQDYWFIKDDDEDGEGGIRGVSGEYAGEAHNGKGQDRGRFGGWGGDGAALGGAVFARKDAEITVINSVFSENEVASGTGHLKNGVKDSVEKGNAIAKEGSNNTVSIKGDGTINTYASSSADTFSDKAFPSLSNIVLGNNTEDKELSFSVDSSLTTEQEIDLYYEITPINGATKGDLVGSLQGKVSKSLQKGKNTITLKGVKTDNLFAAETKDYELRLLSGGSYSLSNNALVNQGGVKDDEPRLKITTTLVNGQRTEGARTEAKNSNVIEIARIDFLAPDGRTVRPNNNEKADIKIEIAGSATRGSLQSPAVGSDYKLFYTAYDDKNEELLSRKAFSDPQANTGIYNISSLPTEVASIKIEAEDINDELFESEETIQIKLLPNLENGKEKYYGLIGETTSTIKILDNEPTVSLGKVVHPSEGFGFGSTISGLEDALSLTNKTFAAVETDPALDLSESGQFTVEAWIFSNDNSNSPQGVLGYKNGPDNKNGFPSISIVGKTGLEIGFGSGTKENKEKIENVLNETAWNHVATTYDGTDYKLYVNAVEVFSTSKYRGSAISSTARLDIGRVGENYFEGAIDEVRVWNVARSAGQIQSQLISQLEGSEPGLVGYWNFNGNSKNSASSTQVAAVAPGATYIKNPAPQIGYVEVNLDKPFEGENGLWVKYEIDSAASSAIQHGGDFFSSRYRKNSNDASTERTGIIITEGQTTGRIYFSALADAVVESDEEIKIKLVPHNFDDEANSSATNSNYGIKAGKETATIIIKDNKSIKKGIVLTDNRGQVISNQNPLVSRNGQLDISVQLSSQPADVVVLKSTQDLFEAITFSTTNWDKPQKVKMTSQALINGEGTLEFEQVKNFFIPVYLDSTIGFEYTDKLPIRVTEGSEDDAKLVTPELSITNQGSVTEDSGRGSNFVINLSASAPKGGLKVNYTVGGSAIAGIDYQSINKVGTLIVPEQATQITIPISTIADADVEGNEIVSITLVAASDYYEDENKNKVPAYIVDSQASSSSLTIINDDRPGISIVNAAVTKDADGKEQFTFANNLTEVVTSEPYLSIGNTVELRNEKGELIGTAQLSSANISAGKVTISPTAALPTDSKLIRAYLKEKSQGSIGLVINNSNLTVSNSNGNKIIEVDLPNAASTSVMGVRLRSRPTAAVIIEFKGVDNTETTLDKTSLTFTPDNWDEYQTIKASGIDDAVIDGDIVYEFKAEVTSSTDANYQGKNLAVTVKNLDDDALVDTSGNPVRQTDLTLPIAKIGQAVTVDEGAGTAQIQVTLSKASTQEVNVLFEPVNGSAIAGKDYTIAQQLLVGQYDQSGQKRFVSPFDVVSNASTEVKPTFADLDKDGDQDLIIGTKEGIQYYENTGGRSLPAFEARTGNSNPFTGIKAENASVTFGDLNGDGSADLVVGAADGTLKYYVNTGGSGVSRFTAPARLNPTPTDPLVGKDVGENATPVLIDVDGDGDLDIVSGSAGSADNTKTLKYYENTGSKTKPVFTESGDSAIASIDAGQNSVPTVVDWDNDGDLDVVVGQQDGSVQLFTKSGNTYATTPQNLLQGLSVLKAGNHKNAAPALVDLDSDGDLDSIVGTTDGSLHHAEQFSIVKFSPGETSKTIDLKIVDDKIAEREEETIGAESATEFKKLETVKISLFSNAGYRLDAQDKESIETTVTITDNDTPGITITPVAGNGNTSEAGGSSQYMLRLNTQPTEDVVVFLGSQDETEALVSIREDLSQLEAVQGLTFTSKNWNKDQAFYIKGVDDKTEDGDITYKIVPTLFSEDQSYHRLKSDGVSLTNTDNDKAGFVITGAGKAVEGRENIYSVKLKTQPVGIVELIAKPTNDQIRLNDELVGEPHALIFTPDNWQFGQTVKATALDDSVVEYLHLSSIDFEVKTGKEFNFESKADNSLAINAIDLGEIVGGFSWKQLAISDTFDSQTTDADWFKFSMPDTGNQKTLARINFDHSAGDLKLDLFKSSNLTTPIQTSDSSGSENFEEISLNGQPFGEYYLKISGVSNALNGYDLLVADEDSAFTKAVPERVPVVIQDNDLPTVTITPGETASEVFGKPSYFAIQLNAPVPANSDGINVKYRLKGGSAQLQKRNYLSDIEDIPTVGGSSNPIEKKDDTGDFHMQPEGVVRIAPGNIQNNLIVVPIDDKLIESFELKVDKVLEASKDSEDNSKYEKLTLVISTPIPPDSNQPDSVSEGDSDLSADENTAGQLQPNDLVIGKIGNAGDRDRFRISLQKDKVYTFDLEGSHTNAGTLSDSYLRLYKPGNSNEPDASNDDGGEGYNARLTYTAEESGDYFVEAGAYGDHIGSYKLKVSAPEVNTNEKPQPLFIAEETEISFGNNLITTVTTDSNLEADHDTGFYRGKVTVQVDAQRKQEILQNSKARIFEETVVVELLPGDGYQLATNTEATLRIQDDDVPGIRIVQVGDNTVVLENEEATFKVALLSEPKSEVKIRLTPGADIDFVDPINPTTVKVEKETYRFNTPDTLSNMAFKLNSLVTSEQEKTIAFDVRFTEKPSSDVYVEFYDAGISTASDKDPKSDAVVKFTHTTPNDITGDEEGNWNDTQQVIIGNLDANKFGKLGLIAKVKAGEAQIGEDIHLGIERTVTQIDKKTTEITISPDRWFDLQTVKVTGVDEGVAEPGLYHESNITYQVLSDDASYNNIFVSQQRIDVVDRVLNAEDTAKSIQTGLTTLQKSVDSLEIPLIGSLKGKTPDIIGQVSDKLVSAISGQQNLSANRIKTIIEGALSSVGVDSLNVSVDISEEDIAIELNFKKVYDIFELPLDSDLGMKGLGLKTEGKVKSRFAINVGLGFGLHKGFGLETDQVKNNGAASLLKETTGFYIDTNKTKVEAAVKIDLDSFKAEGSLGPVKLSIQDDQANPTELAIVFKAGLNDLDNYETIRFLDVDGNKQFNPNTFVHEVKIDKTKTNNDGATVAGKDGRADTDNQGNFITKAVEVQEPFTQLNKKGIAEAFPTPSQVSAETKRVNWNDFGDSKNAFLAPDAQKNEGVYLIQKDSQGNVEFHYLDINRNGKLDQKTKESLFSVKDDASKWFDNKGLLKPFRIDQKKEGKEIKYYFDQNGNNIFDPEEELTKKEKAKIDKNNNDKLDADREIEGEGQFVQGTGIAFRDRNGNGKFDVGESFVNSGFGELKVKGSDLKRTFVDLNGDGQQVSNQTVAYRVTIPSDEEEPTIRNDKGQLYLDVNGDGKFNNIETGGKKEPKLIKPQGQDYLFLDTNGDGKQHSDKVTSSDSESEEKRDTDPIINRGSSYLSFADTAGNDGKQQKLIDFNRDGQSATADGDYITTASVQTATNPNDSTFEYLDTSEDGYWTREHRVLEGEADSSKRRYLDINDNGKVDESDRKIEFVSDVAKVKIDKTNIYLDLDNDGKADADGNVLLDSLTGRLIKDANNNSEIDDDESVLNISIIDGKAKLTQTKETTINYSGQDSILAGFKDQPITYLDETDDGQFTREYKVLRDEEDTLLGEKLYGFVLDIDSDGKVDFESDNPSRSDPLITFIDANVREGNASNIPLINLFSETFEYVDSNNNGKYDETGSGRSPNEYKLIKDGDDYRIDQNRNGKADADEKFANVTEYLDVDDNKAFTDGADLIVGEVLDGEHLSATDMVNSDDRAKKLIDFNRDGETPADIIKTANDDFITTAPIQVMTNSGQGTFKYLDSSKDGHWTREHLVIEAGEQQYLDLNDNQRVDNGDRKIRFIKDAKKIRLGNTSRYVDLNENREADNNERILLDELTNRWIIDENGDGKIGDQEPVLNIKIADRIAKLTEIKTHGLSSKYIGQDSFLFSLNNGRIVTYLDETGDGKLTREYKVLQDEEDTPTGKKLRRMVLDINGNGKIDFESGNPSKSDPLINYQLKFGDKNRDGKLDKDEAIIYNSIDFVDMNGSGQYDSGDLLTKGSYFDVNGNGIKDAGEPQLSDQDWVINGDNVVTYKIVTAGNKTFVDQFDGGIKNADQSEEGTFQEKKDIDLFKQYSLTALQAKVLGLDGGAKSYTGAELLKLKLRNNQIVDKQITFVSLEGSKKLNLLHDPIVRIENGVQYADLDRNGRLTKNGEGERIEPFALPNNTFNTDELEGSGKIIKLLDDGNRLTLNELINLANDKDRSFTSLFNYELSGLANLGLKAKADFTAAFPNLALDLAVSLPLFNYGNQSEASKNGLEVELNNVTIDFGTFLTGVIKPMIENVDQILTPIKPIIKLLNTDTKIFSYIGLEKEFNRDGIPGVSILDIAQAIADTIPEDTTDKDKKRIKDSVKSVNQINALINKVVDITASLKKLSDSGKNIILDIGSYNLEDFKGVSKDPADSASEVKAETQGKKNFAQTTPAQQAKTGTEISSDQKSILDKFLSLEGLSLPILTNPLTAIKILLGEPGVDLIKYDVPNFDLFFEKERVFPFVPFPALGLSFNAAAELQSDISFGYDTAGVEAWKEDGFSQSSVYKVLDGFYLDDFDSNGEDKDELTAAVAIAAGLSASAVVAKAVLSGGIRGTAGFDVIDEGELQGKNDGKIRGSEIISQFQSARSQFQSSKGKSRAAGVAALLNEGESIAAGVAALFDLKGSFDAFLKGEVRVGIDAILIESMKTIWSKDFSRNLAKFSVGANGASFSSSLSNSYINTATIFFDANFNGQWDAEVDVNGQLLVEPITYTNEYGQYSLEVGQEWDVNGDGEIDINDGQIIGVGGYDTSSGSEGGRFVGLPNSIIVTPLTSLQVPLVRAGLEPTEAADLIKAQLGLDPAFNLQSFDSLKAVGQDQALGLDIYLAHIQVHALFSQSRAFIDGLQGENVDSNGLQLIHQSFATFLRDRATTTTTPYDLSDKGDIQDFFLYLAAEYGTQATISQLIAAAEVVASTNTLLDEISAVGLTKSIEAALPALAAVKRIAQSDVVELLSQLADSTTTPEQTLEAFNKTLNQNYTLVGSDINSFGNRSVSIKPTNTTTSENASKAVDFTIELSSPAPNQGLKVLYSVSGTATLGEDYTTSAQTLGEAYIEAGETSTTVSFSTVNDAVGETLENIVINLKSVGEGFLIDPLASVALLGIVDNDTAAEAQTGIGSTREGTFGNDSFIGEDGDDIFTGGEGDDTLIGQGGKDFLSGGHGKDMLTGGDGDDILEGNFDDDNLHGNAGKDIIRGGSGNDIITGGADADSISAGVGNDSADGGAGNDQIKGDGGDDIIMGGADNDWLLGNGGEDILVGGTGDDLLNGGAGADVFYFGSKDEGFDTIVDFNPEQGDKIQVSASGFDGANLKDFRFISGVLDYRGENLALIQNKGATYAYFPDLTEVIEVVDQPEKASLTDTLTDTSTVPEQLPRDFNVKDAEHTILDEIIARGYLRVATSEFSTDFDLEFAGAIAAVLFGDATKVEQVEENEDISASRYINNVLLDDVDFSPVYLYDHQAIVVRKDSGINNAIDLAGKTIGVAESSAGEALSDALTVEGDVEYSTQSYDSLEAMIAAYDAGDIDAYSTDQTGIFQQMSMLSDPDNHQILDTEVAKVPISLATPQNDSQLNDVIRWITYAPIQAEEFGITSENIDLLISLNTDKNSDNDSSPEIRRFLGVEGNLGAALGIPNDFVVNIIRQVGNYAEIYNRHFEGLDRNRNLLARDGGLLYSPPFSGTLVEDPGLIDNNDRDVLQDVLEKGYVTVGVFANAPGFSAPESEGADELIGFDIDLGRAIAGALFNDPNAVKFVTQETQERFSNTANGVVDVSASQASHNLVRDGLLGVDFSPIYLYTGQGVVVRKNSGIFNLAMLNGRKVGVLEGATSEQNLKDRLFELGATAMFTLYKTEAEMLEAYDMREIDAISNDLPFLSASIPTFSNPTEHFILDDVLSKEALAMVVDENQSAWLEVVSAVYAVLIQAEEYGLTRANIDSYKSKDRENLTIATGDFLGLETALKKRLLETYGLSTDFAVNAIKAVGNYGEIYDRHFNDNVLRRGDNALSDDYGLQQAVPLGLDNFFDTGKPEGVYGGFEQATEGDKGFFKVSGSTKMQLTLTDSSTTQSGEFAVFAIDDETGLVDGIAPTEDNYLETILAQGRLLGGMNLLASEGNPKGLPSDLDLSMLEQLLVLSPGTRFGFLLVEDGTVDELLNGMDHTVRFSNSDSFEVRNFSADSFEMRFDNGASRFAIALNAFDSNNSDNDYLTTGRLAQTGPEVLDLTDVDSLTGQVTIYSEADFNNTVGLYRTNKNGDILDAEGNILAQVGDSNYKEVLMQRAQALNIAFSSDGGGEITLPGNTMLAPFIIADGDFNNYDLDTIYTPFIGTNADNTDHFRVLGKNVFGVEDQFGGGDRDFDDMIIRIDL